MQACKAEVCLMRGLNGEEWGGWIVLCRGRCRTFSASSLGRSLSWPNILGILGGWRLLAEWLSGNYPQRKRELLSLRLLLVSSHYSDWLMGVGVMVGIKVPGPLLQGGTTLNSSPSSKDFQRTVWGLYFACITVSLFLLPIPPWLPYRGPSLGTLQETSCLRWVSEPACCGAQPETFSAPYSF